MKNIVLIVLALLLIGGGVFAFIRMPVPSATVEIEASGVVTDVDLNAVTFDGPAFVTIRTESGERVIVVPSMGLPLCPAFDALADVYEINKGDTVSVKGILDAEGRIVPCEDGAHYLSVTAVAEDAAFGYRFTYPKGPDGYISFEDTESTDEDFIAGVVLFKKAEYEELQKSTDAREGPPAIHVRVYQNPNKYSAFVWPLQKPRESNIELAFAEPQEAVLAGANASHYIVDGLYPIDTYVVASGEHVYVLMGAYFEQGDAHHRAFQSLVDSFELIPNAAQS